MTSPPNNILGPPGEGEGDGDDDGENGLTCIHGRIHCGAAGGPIDDENESHQIEIRHFIDALAELALAVARRKEGLEP